MRGNRLHVAPALEQWHEFNGEGSLTVGAKHQAGKGDADLARSDIAVELGRILQCRQEMPGKVVAFFGQLADAAPAHADRGELRCDIEGIDGDEEDNNQPGYQCHCDDS